MMLYVDIQSTVKPERKLIVPAEAKLKESSTGLIITPPPIPHIDPATDARKPTSSKVNSIFYLFIRLCSGSSIFDNTS